MSESMKPFCEGLVRSKQYKIIYIRTKVLELRGGKKPLYYGRMGLVDRMDMLSSLSKSKDKKLHV